MPTSYFTDNRPTDKGYSRVTTHNYGIDILRIWMCFEVILLHFWTYTPTGNPILIFFEDFRCVAVPCFMFLSFLLCAHTLDNPDLSFGDIKKRIRRIVIPILFWGIAYYILFNVSYLLLDKGNSLTLSDLLLQIIVGHVYNTPMWFLNDMLALTLVVVVMNRFVPYNRLILANICLTAVSLLFCLSGFNFRCFGGMSFELRYPVGRFFEMLPYVGIANILFLSRKHFQYHLRLLTLCILLALICCAVWTFSDIDWPDTFGYGSPYQYIMSVPLVLLMLHLSFDSIWAPLRRTISYIAHYTLGIYCVHLCFGILCNNLCSHFGLPENTFTGCLAIFFISFAVCCIIAVFPWSWIKKAVS